LTMACIEAVLLRRSTNNAITAKIDCAAPELFAAHGVSQVDLNLMSQHLMTIKVVSDTAPHVFY